MSKIGLAPCNLHAHHEPEPLTSEDHHVEPQAWQHFKMTGHGVEARAMEERAAGAGMLYTKLYNPHTVRLAPTCHRNVHFWIVKIMKAFEALAAVHSPGAIDDEVLLDQAVRDVRSQTGVRGMVFQTAIEAPRLHMEHGGSLRRLVDAKLYGNA